MAGRELTQQVAANSFNRVSLAGEFLFIKSSTGTLEIEINGDVVNMVEGDKQKVIGGFPGFIAKNNSGAAITVTYIVGKGDFDTAAVVGTVKQTAASIETAADYIPGGAGTSAITGLAADTTRRSATITALVGNAAEIRIGDSNTGAARGTPLQPGETETISSEMGAASALYVYVANGTDGVAIQLATS